MTYILWIQTIKGIVIIIENLNILKTLQESEDDQSGKVDQLLEQ